MKTTHLTLLVTGLVALAGLLICCDSDESDADLADPIREMLKRDLEYDGYRDSTGTIQVHQIIDSTGHGTNQYDVEITTKDPGSFRTINARGSDVFLSTYRGYIKNLSLSGGFQEIGSNTFAGFTALSMVHAGFGTQPVKVGNMAFKNCTALDYFDGYLGDVGIEAFANCPLLGAGHSELMLQVKGNIEQSAFSGCKNLNNVQLRGKVGHIGQDAFAGCTSFQGFGSVLQGCPDVLEVDEIQQRAFAGCQSLKSIRLKAGSEVMDIGREAFKASGLTSVDFTYVDGHTVRFGEGAFSDCAYLGTVILNGTPSSLLPYAFSGCASLSSWDSKMCPGSSLPTMAFAGCNALTRLTISLVADPDHAKERFTIETGALRGCEMLSSIEIGGDSGYVTTLKDRALADLINLRTFSLTGKVVLEGDYIFSGCRAVEKIEIHLQKVSDGYVLPSRFVSGCEALREFTLHMGGMDLHIPDESFSSCTGLRKASFLESSCILVGSYVFGGTGSLESFIVSADSDIIVRANSFRGQAGLRYVEYPNSDPARISSDSAEYAFYGCTSLHRVALGAKGISNNVARSMFEDSGITSVQITGTYSVSERGFAGCTKLMTIGNNTSLGSIGREAFAGCISLTSINVRYSHLNYSENAFSGCTSLTSVHLAGGDRLTDIPAGIFTGCSQLREFSLSLNVGYWDRDRPGMEIHPDAFRGCLNLQRFTVENIGSHAIIAENAFSGCDSLLDICFKPNYTDFHISINSLSVRGLPSLTGFHDPYQNNLAVVVTGAGDYAFAGCASLLSIRLENTLFFEHMFEGSGLLFAPTLNATQAEVFESTFANCVRMQSFAPSYSVSLRGINTFSGCSNLGEVRITLIPEIGTGPLTIPLGTFAGCMSLREVSINCSNCDIILDTGTFASCPSLVRILLDNQHNVTICPNVFSAEGKLREVRVGSESSVTVQRNSFRGQASLLGIYRGMSGDVPAPINGDNPQFAFAGCSNLAQVNLAANGQGVIDVAESMFEGAGLTSVGFSNEVHVGARAFAGCTKLECITPALRGTIGNAAFEGCTSLKQVSVRFLSADMMQNVFAGCTNLLTVDIEIAAQVVLAQGFFSGCSSLTTVNLTITDQSVSSLSVTDEVFRGCSKLVLVSIDGRISELVLGVNTFAGCENLADIRLPDQSSSPTIVSCTNSSLSNLPALLLVGDSGGNPATISFPVDGSYGFAGCASLRYVRLVDGFVFEHMFDGAGLVSAPLTEASEFRLCERAFANCDHMTDFITDKPVSLVGTSIFSGCTSLEKVDMSIVPQNSEATSRIPAGTFSGCGLLTAVWIDALGNEMSLDSELFATCSELVTVTVCSSPVLHVSPNVFSSYAKLQEVSVSEGSAIEVESNAFRGQTSLLGIHVVGSTGTDAPVRGHDARSAFAGCTKLSSIRLQGHDEDLDNKVAESMFEGSGLESVSFLGPVVLCDRAFAGCVQLRQISEATILTMNDSVFAGCINLAAVEMNVSDLSGATSSFSGCSKLSRVHLVTATDSRTVLPYALFNGCSYLSELVLDGGFQLERNVFNGCERLYRIDITERGGLHMEAEALRGVPQLEGVFVRGTSSPSKITLLGDTDHAFYGCSKLRSVLLGHEGGPATVGSYMFYNCQELNSVVFDGSILWKGIGTYAFAGCSFLREVRMSDGSDLHLSDIVVIGTNAFSGCGSLEDLSIDMGGNPLEFSTGSVSNNSALRRIVITNVSGAVFGDYSLGGCPSLEEIRMSSRDPSYRVTLEEGALTGAPNLSVLDVGDMKLSVGPRSMENLARLSTVATAGIVAVGDHGMYNCGLIHSLVFDPSIRTIGDYAFARCAGLEPLPLGDMGLEYIGRYAFSGCEKIVTLDFSRSELRTIGEGAFSSCVRLSTVRLPVTLTHIENDTFMDCGRLNDVNLSDLLLLESIGDRAFRSTSLSDVRLPFSVRILGAEAFSGCQRITAVTIGERVETIGHSAFLNCTSLTSIDLPASLVFLGEQVFKGCSNLQGADLRGVTLQSVPAGTFSDCVRMESVLLPNGTTAIGKEAFHGCTNLYLIDFGDVNRVEYVGDGAFEGCGMLLRLEFPSIRHLGAQVFRGCGLLTELVLSAEMEIGSEFGDFMFEGCENLTSVNIPENVFRIGEHTFSGCLSLIVVVLPSTLKSIGLGAFESCTALATLRSEGGEIVSLGTDTFNGCFALENLEVSFCCILPDRAFEGCIALRSLDLSGCHGPVPANLAHGCISLETVLLPADCSVIGEHAFDGCSRLVLPTINDLRGELTVGAHAFEGCVALSIFPSCTIISLGEASFRGCANLDMGMVTYTLTEIPAQAFQGCTGLTNIPSGAEVYGPHSFEGVAVCAPDQVLTLSNVRSVGEYAFCNDRTLGFVFGDHLADVGDHAFENTAFNGDIRGDRLRSIGVHAFAGCQVVDLTVVSGESGGFVLGDFSFANCQQLTSVKVSAVNLQGFSSTVFHNCPRLVSIDLGGSFTEYNGALYTPDMTVLYKVVKHISGNYTLHPSVSQVEGYAFAGCSDVTSLENTSGIVSIGDHAFECCSSLTGIDLPRVTSVGPYAFAGSGVRTVSMPSVTSIPDGLFKECSLFTSVGILNQVSVIGALSFSGCVSIPALEIPRGILSIGDGAFKGCTGLKGIVTVPATVSTFGDGVFQGCTGIEEVRYDRSGTVPQDCFHGCLSLRIVELNSRVTLIGEGAFSGCIALEGLQVPNSVTTIGEGAFEGCTAIRSLVLPDNLFSVSDRLFRGCTSLEYLIMPYLVVSIGDEAFSGCTALLHVDLQNRVRHIGCGAFSGCVGLKDISVPNSVTSIGSAAFSGCTGLEMFNMPELVTSVEESTFMGCTSLSGVVLHQNIRAIGPRAFSGDHRLIGLSGTDGLVTIGDLAFDDCRSLQSFNIGPLVEDVAFDAFRGCGSIVSMYVSLDNRNFSTDGVVVYECRDDRPSILLKVLPGSEITSIEVPDSVKVISPMAFFGLPRLKEVHLLGEVGVLGDRCFEQCPSLETITVSSGAFHMAESSLLSVDGTRLVAFVGHGKLSIPASVRTIDAGVFLSMGNCSGVEIDSANMSYRIINGALCSIDGRIMYYLIDCSKEYTISSDIREVSTYAISGSSPESVVISGATVFRTDSIFSCHSLKYLDIRDRAVSFEDDAISAGTRDSPSDIHVRSPEGFKVPANALGKYTKVENEHKEADQDDDLMIFLLPAAAVIVIAAICCIGVVMVRRH